MPALRKAHPVLAAQILSLYESKQADDEFAFIDPDYADKQGEAAYKSIQFVNYYKSPSRAVQDIIDEFNTAENRTVEPVLKAASRTNIGEAIRGRLREKGYSREEINDLAKNVSNAVDIANDPMSKAERDSADAATARAEELQDKEKSFELMATIDSFISEAKTYDELQIAKKDIFFLLDKEAYPTINSPDGWAILLPEAEKAGAKSIGTVIENLIESKEKEIAFTVRIEDIVPGSTIILKSGAQMIVDEIAKDKTILAHKATTPEKIIEFTLNQVKFTSAAAQAQVDIVDDQITAQDNTQQVAHDAIVDDTEDAINEDAESEDDDEDIEIC